MDRFHRDMTKETQAIALGYCEKLIKGYEQAEGIEDLRSANDYVQAAIVDTMQGIRTWDPDRGPRGKKPLPLFRHLCRVVYSRVHHDRQRFKRQRMASYHEVDLDDENSVEVAMSLRRDDERRRPEGAAILRDLHAKGWAWLRTAAAKKTRPEDMLTLIDHLEIGVTGEPAIRGETGWSEQRYQNACRRFATLVRHMPGELHDAILDAIVRSPANTGSDWSKPKGTEVGAEEERRRRAAERKGRDPDDEPELYEHDPDEDGEREPDQIDAEEEEAP